MYMQSRAFARVPPLLARALLPKDASMKVHAQLKHNIKHALTHKAPPDVKTQNRTPLL